MGLKGKDRRGDYVLDDATRGQILRLIKTELDEEIRSRIEWIEMPISEDLALGYIIGLLEEKARNILSIPSLYCHTIDKTTKDMIRDYIPKIKEKIRTGRYK